MTSIKTVRLIVAFAVTLAPLTFAASSVYAESCQERCYRIYGYGSAGHRCAANC